ncbi:hypothetical protein [Breznakiella homolactica]|uniref:Uncharacterized protein n=1 Tax=Breznakiella homolactica TaxID=2798577 RepID=A0A7T7XK90_9SPIR|nr:hypothetical protein [Breznakiella homolactica]QQO07797.1 hypothetical protein JFL75_12700 [Breznakiella homolactica]
MADTETRMAALIQNLRDAECGDEAISRFLELGKKNRIGEQLTLLAAHRAALLGNVRRAQKSLDCMDYLIFNLKKENPGQL